MGENDPPAPQSPEPTAGAPAFVPDRLRTLELKPHLVEALSQVFDPEIPVNIYELGLIYDLAADSGSNVQVRMTLTSPACPAAQQLPGDVRDRVRTVPGVQDVQVEVVWEPPWSPDRMSETARLQLGML